MENVEKGELTKDGYLDEIKKDGKHESGEYGEDCDKEKEKWSHWRVGGL